MKPLNKLTGFQWATRPLKGSEFAKICISGESFWVSQCEPYGEGFYRGVVDNELSQVQGLQLGDVVVFAFTELS